MELWIRSQDKERLEKVETLELFKYSNDEWGVESNCCSLGKYKTKKRALEILDEIEYLLSGDSIEDFINSSNDLNMNNVFPIIRYVMPKE